MNKKNLNQLLFLLSCLLTQNNTLNAMKRTIDLISCSEITVYPPLKQRKLATNVAAFVCDICDKSFSRRGNLTKHIRIHTGEKHFSCSFCDKNFTQKSTLVVHERTHTGEKPYFCSFCDKNFTQKSNLIDHERIHTKEKPFSCSFCDKTFTHQSTLTAHERTHTKEKPFSCSLCDKSFIQKNNLTKHMATHAKNDSPPINSSRASSQEAPIHRASALLAPLVIQKIIEIAQTQKNKQSQKNEKIIEEAMKPLNDDYFISWISSKEKV